MCKWWLSNNDLSLISNHIAKKPSHWHKRLVANNSDSEDDVPIASYSDLKDDITSVFQHCSLRDLSLPPSSDPVDSLQPPEKPHRDNNGLSPDHTPRTTQQHVCNAVSCLLNVTSLASKWNKGWGKMLGWSQQFMNWYMAAVHKMRADVFIEGVIRTIQVG